MSDEVMAEDLTLDMYIRLVALELSVKSFGSPKTSSGEGYLPRAKRFENYIKKGQIDDAR